MNVTPEVKKTLLNCSIHVGAALVMMGSYFLMKFRVVSKLEFYCAVGVMIMVLLSGQVAEWQQHRRDWKAGDRGPMARLSKYSSLFIIPTVGLLVGLLNYALFEQHLLSEGWHLILIVTTRLSFGVGFFVALPFFARDLRKERQGRPL